MWAVFDPAGNITDSVEMSEESAKMVFAGWDRNDLLDEKEWLRYKDAGYSCREVEVKEVEGGEDAE